MFKLTEKAKKFDSFIIHSCESAVTDYSAYGASEKDVWEAVRGDEWVKEAISEGNTIDVVEKLFISSLAVFTASEMLEAAESGYGWPLVCGYCVEEDEEDEEDESMMSINTKAPAKFLNFSREKLQFWLSDEPSFNEIATKTFVSIFTGSLGSYLNSWSVAAEAIFDLPGDPEQYSRPAHEDVISSLLQEEVGTTYELEIKSVEVYVPEILGNSLETAVKIVNGTIVPRIFVQLSCGDYIEYHLNLPDWVQYHPTIEKEIEKMLEKSRRLSDAVIELTPKDVASYILQEGGAYWAGRVFGWILEDVKNEKAMKIVGMWNRDENPATPWEVEVFGHLKDYLS